MAPRSRRQFVIGLAGAGLAFGSGLALASLAQAPGESRAFTVAARRYAFDPARIEVAQDDLVQITLRSEDIAHSFTVDEYRIAKRVAGGQAVTFEFRADRAGRFPIYCSLRQDERCREMRGELVVHPR